MHSHDHPSSFRVRSLPYRRVALQSPIPQELFEQIVFELHPIKDDETLVLACAEVSHTPHAVTRHRTAERARDGRTHVVGVLHLGIIIGS